MLVHSHKEYISDKLRKEGGYERKYIELILSHIKSGDTVLDIGANIGLHTLHYSTAVGPKGTVLAFEPDPDNLKLLHFNVVENNCTNVKIYPFALGSHRHKRKLYLCERNKGKQSFADLDNLLNPINIEVYSAIDVPGIMEASVVKIDVEGAEPMVFDGFKKFRPQKIFFEFTIT